VTEKNPKEKLKRDKSNQQAEKSNEVEKGGFPVGRRMENREAKREQPRKQGAPISVDGIVPISAQIGRSNVQVTGAVGRGSKALSPDLEKARDNRNAPSGSAERKKPLVGDRVGDAQGATKRSEISRFARNDGRSGGAGKIRPGRQRRSPCD